MTAEGSAPSANEPSSGAAELRGSRSLCSSAMGEPVRGIYERLITAGLEADLATLASELVDRGKLDPADADEVLARHVAVTVRRALRSLPATDHTDERDLLARQVAVTNRILSTIQNATPTVTTPDDQVANGELFSRSWPAPAHPGRSRR